MQHIVHYSMFPEFNLCDKGVKKLIAIVGNSQRVAQGPHPGSVGFITKSARPPQEWSSSKKQIAPREGSSYSTHVQRGACTNIVRNVKSWILRRNSDCRFAKNEEGNDGAGKQEAQKCGRVSLTAALFFNLKGFVDDFRQNCPATYFFSGWMKIVSKMFSMPTRAVNVASPASPGGGAMLVKIDFNRTGINCPARKMAGIGGKARGYHMGDPVLLHGSA